MVNGITRDLDGVCTLDATGERVYRMNAAAYARLESELEEMNRRASRLKCEPVKYEVVASELCTVGAKGDERPVRFHYVRVIGGRPQLNGWRFVAVIEPTEAGNILKAVPGESVPVKYRDASSHCDHCGIRRERNATYVIAHEDGRYAQVGSTCLADYVGSRISPAQLAAQAEFGFRAHDIDSGDDGDDGVRSWYEPFVESLDFLTTVAALSRQFGFVTRKQADANGGVPTGARAFAMLTLPHVMRDERELHGYQGTNEADAAIAINALEHSRTMTGESDFDHNLRTAARLDAISSRHSGILAYAVENFRRYVENEIKAAREARAPRREPVHVGTVGKREVFAGLKVVRIHEFESDFSGSYRLVRFADEHGNTIVWSTGSPVDWLYDAEESGELVNVKASVKAHDFYKGEAQTRITRAVPA